MHEQTFMPLFGALGWLSILLLVGVFLRAKITFFQKFLFPAAIIGGLIGFIFKSMGWCNISHDIFVSFTIHLFTLSFISIGLTGIDKTDTTKKGSMTRSIIRGMLWIACVYVAVISIQALLGGGILYLTNKVGKPLYTGLGMLVGTGFAQGPGQTVALASVWENSFQVQDAVSIGLSFAAIGYLIASFVGVPLANWGVRRGLVSDPETRISKSVVVGLNSPDDNESAGRLTTHSGNIDGLAFQLAIVLAVYFLTYQECRLLKSVLPEAVKGIAFGLMFLWGMFTAFIIRWILDKIGWSVYIDSNVQRRITGFSVDFMIVATMIAVRVAAVWTHLLPILLVSLVAGVVTTLFIVYFGRRLDEFGFERMLAVYGTATGTGASGLMLLRIVDPDFKSPAAMELALYNVFSIVLLPLTLVTYPLPGMNVSILFWCLGGYILVALVLLRVFGFWGKRIW